MLNTDKRKRSGGDRSVESKSKVLLSNAAYSAKNALTPVPTITQIRAVVLSPVARVAVTLSTGVSVTAHPSELLDQRSFRRLAREHGVDLPRVSRGVWRAKVRRVASQNRGR